MNNAQKVATAVPRLSDGVERQEQNGQLRLIGPPFRRGPVRRIFARIMGLADRVRVELDDIGRYVITRVDGHSTMTDLARDLATYLRLERREAEAALTAFMRSLLQRKLVQIRFEEGSR